MRRLEDCQSSGYRTPQSSHYPTPPCYAEGGDSRDSVEAKPKDPDFAVGDVLVLKLDPTRRFTVVRNYIAYKQPTAAGERWLELTIDGRPAFWKESQMQRV